MFSEWWWASACSQENHYNINLIKSANIINIYLSSENVWVIVCEYFIRSDAESEEI